MTKDVTPEHITSYQKLALIFNKGFSRKFQNFRNLKSILEWQTMFLSGEDSFTHFRLMFQFYIPVEYQRTSCFRGV